MGALYLARMPCFGRLLSDLDYPLCFFSVPATSEVMGRLQLTGRNLGQVFNSRSGCMRDMQLLYFEAKLPNVMLKTRLKQLPCSLPLEIALHGEVYFLTN